jgi:hypothetical protein
MKRMKGRKLERGEERKNAGKGQKGLDERKKRGERRTETVSAASHVVASIAGRTLSSVRSFRPTSVASASRCCRV